MIRHLVTAFISGVLTAIACLIVGLIFEQFNSLDFVVKIGTVLRDYAWLFGVLSFLSTFLSLIGSRRS